MREVQDGEDNEEDWEEMEGGDEEEPKERGLGEPRVKKVLVGILLRREWQVARALIN